MEAAHAARRAYRELTPPHRMDRTHSSHRGQPPADRNDAVVMIRDEDTEEDNASAGASDDDSSVETDVQDDIERFEHTYPSIAERYKLINRIGEGTFSTVYKAEDMLYERYENAWEGDMKSQQQPRTRFVAIKKIYVTSSPQRILNELELLNDLRDAPNVCPLITALRSNDQVVAILPYFPHKDFREYYRDFTIPDIRLYLQSLVTALCSVHEEHIIHRDIKPTNFLYSPSERRGVLVDFGLAEREGTDYVLCACVLDEKERAKRINNSSYAATVQTAHTSGQAHAKPSYPSNDQRPSRRANRAGTRGFRAPEVLLKCTAQTCKIDIWSVGVILLTFLTHRFPFFHSADDVDAFIELCTIFGKKRMRDAALLHGQVLHTNLPTVADTGHSWEKIILWCTHRSKKGSDGNGGLSQEELEAIEFMKVCFVLDPNKRITAKEALQHPFLADIA